MLALHTLIHSLAKEEKRLYNLHGRDSRFKKIYESYAQQSEFDKTLDKRIYEKEYSTFSRAFYSMQKNALLEDILAVLLEYSNSSDIDFNLSRLKSKYEVLIHKGFFDLGLDYLKNALEVAKSGGKYREYAHLLEEYSFILSKASNSTWEDFQKSAGELQRIKAILEEKRPIEDYSNELKVLLISAKNQPENYIQYKEVASSLVLKMNALGESVSNPEIKKEIIYCEYQFSKAFEDKLELHKRLIDIEKKYNRSEFAYSFRVKLINLLMESSLDCGDFLRINGLIYKTQNEIEFKPKTDFIEEYSAFLELCGIYHFYENDLPLSQKELTELLEMDHLTGDQIVHYSYLLASVQVAANLPRSANDTLDKLSVKVSGETRKLHFKMMKLIVLVESNETEKALLAIQKLKTLIKQSVNPRKLAPYRQFLEMLAKHLQKRKVTFNRVSGLMTDWHSLLKLNLWLSAKMDNTFYYNKILNYWQERKQIL